MLSIRRRIRLPQVPCLAFRPNGFVIIWLACLSGRLFIAVSIRPDQVATPFCSGYFVIGQLTIYSQLEGSLLLNIGIKFLMMNRDRLSMNVGNSKTTSCAFHGT